MKRRSIVSKLFSLVLVAMAAASIGCGSGNSEGKTANIEAGSMPAGADWTGVYYSPLFGYLHLEQQGNRIEGKWQRPRKGEWGKLTGKVDGNLIRFEWEEYIDGLVGPNSKKSGKGYFVYSRPEGENVNDEIKGEIGRGHDEVGIKWEAVKQRDVEPDLDSIGGSGARDVGGGDWDSQNTEPGEPEEPAEPEEDREAPEL